MKLHDSLIGALLLALSAWVLWTVQSYPGIPGQNIGPDAFPRVVALLLGGCGAVLIWRGWRQHRPEQRWAEVGDWLQSAPHRRNLAVTLGGVLAYIGLSDTVGFLPCAAALMAAMMWTLGVRRRWILPLAVLSAVLVHTVFYTLLRVPLPWGWLTPISW